MEEKDNKIPVYTFETGISEEEAKAMHETWEKECQSALASTQSVLDALTEVNSPNLNKEWDSKISIRVY